MSWTPDLGLPNEACSNVEAGEGHDAGDLRELFPPLSCLLSEGGEADTDLAGRLHGGQPLLLSWALLGVHDEDDVVGGDGADVLRRQRVGLLEVGLGPGDVAPFEGDRLEALGAVLDGLGEFEVRCF